jgi:hypothetical protein
MLNYVYIVKVPTFEIVVLFSKITLGYLGIHFDVFMKTSFQLII